MFIEICEDVVKDAIVKADNQQNLSRDLLINMVFCAQRGKHYVYVPCLYSNRELYSSLAELIGRSYVAILGSTNSHRNEVQIIKKKTSVYTLLTYGTAKQSDKDVIVVNPQTRSDFELWTETYVLTENIIDSDFYLYLAKYYQRKEGLIGLKISFYPLMGGGVTMEKVLEKEISLEQHYCLAIADSDMKMPPNNNVTPYYGDTANKIKKLLSNEPFNCDGYILQRVMEIENLIPKKIVYCCTNQHVDILPVDPSFLDMKKGLTLESLYDDEVCRYWRGLLPEKKKEFEERDRYKKNEPLKEDYCKAVKGCAPIIQGFGSDLLKKVLGKTDERDSGKRCGMCNCLYNVSDKCLNAFQQNEWYDLGKKFFDWTCGLKVNL